MFKVISSLEARPWVGGKWPRKYTVCADNYFGLDILFCSLYLNLELANRRFEQTTITGSLNSDN